MGWSVKLVYTAGVRTGVHVCALCVKTGIIFKMRNTFIFHVWAQNIYGTSSTTYLITFLKVISKVLFINICWCLQIISADLFDWFICCLLVEQPCQTGGLCNPNWTKLSWAEQILISKFSLKRLWGKTGGAQPQNSKFLQITYKWCERVARRRSQFSNSQEGRFFISL